MSKKNYLDYHVPLSWFFSFLPLTGVKGVYSSMIIEGAACFFHQYTSCLNERYAVMWLIKYDVGRELLMQLKMPQGWVLAGNQHIKP